MTLTVLPDADAVAREGARVIAEEARAAVAARGAFTLAVSGGRTPWIMLRALSTEQVPWPAVHIFQVDERVAPAGHQDRNLTYLLECLRPIRGLSPDRVYAMPVERSPLDDGAAAYGAILQTTAGSPPVLDLVHLGLGTDGHTASLVPGDAALDVQDSYVAVTGRFQGRRRMTLTFPVLNSARRVLWIVTGEEKRSMLARLRVGDPSIPAGRVSREQALIVSDQEAAGFPGA